MNEYLNELESDIEDIESRVNYALSSFKDVEREFENMESKLEDIQSVIDNEVLTPEGMISEIESILARC